jgi:hypothetical protein
MKTAAVFFFLFLIRLNNGFAGEFVISAAGRSVPMVVSSDDFQGVIRAFRDLQHDIQAVTNTVPDFFIDSIPGSTGMIIAGTLGSSVIDKLILSGKLVTDIAGKWETFQIQVVKNPFAGVDEALVIAGSDKRGTIYGVYEVSARIGVSPWYWWADVPVGHRDPLYLPSDVCIKGPPSVKYRGIFLNDEAPDLTNWLIEKFGTVKPGTDPPVPPGVANYNHQFYSKLFELILRLKGNYLWPAMWNNAFNEDDPENARLADEYGIVMGTSHQEPMLRAQKEWDRRYKATTGSWNYVKNADLLDEFWRAGIRRNKNFESIITLGLRGADDTEMAPGGPEANRALLEHIVGVQRQIIAGEMNADVKHVPQVWCLYKEVLEYYKAGMRVPDDVTLLWAEDNWGNIRRLPTPEERTRSGGAGIYYHFDYHGGPRSYQWINTNPIPKIWDQLSLARQYGADRIWIVNAGHFKGYEFPTEYFLNLAWYADSLTGENFQAYTRAWSAAQFGSDYAPEIADIICKYTKYNGRRKPELLEPTTYSLVNYREAETVVSDFRSITHEAEEIYNKLPEDRRDAFYQLVLFPTRASCLVNELYVTAGKNELYARQGRSSTNDMALKTQSLFRDDTSLMGYFNNSFANGKWKHFMDQPHLGYTSWRDPPVNNLCAIKLTQLQVPDSALMGISIEGSEAVWPGARQDAVLPEFDIFNRQVRYLEIFNRGKIPFGFKITVSKPWIKISKNSGTLPGDKRITIEIDWKKIRKGRSQGFLTIEGGSKKAVVNISVFNPREITPEMLDGFVETNGCVSMESGHYTKKTDTGEYKWTHISDYGHTLSAMRAESPVNSGAAKPGINSPCLEYRLYLFTTGILPVDLVFAPTLNFIPGAPVRYGISIDNEIPQIITLVPADYDARNGNADWEKSVRDNMRQGHSNHQVLQSGYHTLKIWMVDPGLVLQKIVVNTGGVRPSYLGPPESYFGPASPKANQ